jgi:hypothetical protein
MIRHQAVDVVRLDEPMLHKSASSSSLTDEMFPDKVYVPGQHNERSTAFLHKHRRGGYIRREPNLFEDAFTVVRHSRIPPVDATQLPLPESERRVSTTSAITTSAITYSTIGNIATSAMTTGTTSGNSFSYEKPNTAPALPSSPAPLESSASTSSSDDSSEDSATTRRKMIRKKSGELVKSSLKLPSLMRTQSMPTKMVHFASNLEHVRRFCRREKPTAVSTNNIKEPVSFQWQSSEDDNSSDQSSDDGSDDDDESFFSRPHKPQWHVSLPNFTPPEDVPGKPVYLDSVFVSGDKCNLIGHICVKNWSFSKSVVVRYTLDFWKTVSEVSADYNGDVRRRTQRQGYDRFTFSIRLEDLPQQALGSKSMFFCIRYNCELGEFWDNNNALNYEVMFSKPKQQQQQQQRQQKHHQSMAGTKVVEPPKFRGHRRAKTHPNPDIMYDRDFDHQHEVQVESTLDEHLDRKPAPMSSSATKQPNKLTSRYNFGASLTAASRQNRRGSDEDVKATAGGRRDSPTNRPAWDSMSYHDIISKYCFFNGPTAKSATPPPKSPSLMPQSVMAAASAVAHSLTPSSGSPLLVPPSLSSSPLTTSSSSSAYSSPSSSSSSTPTRTCSPGVESRLSNSPTPTLMGGHKPFNQSVEV